MAESKASPPGSVSQEIDGLKRNDPEAIRNLWDRYFQQLRRFARRKLGDFPRDVADSEDIALNVFTSLCRGVKAGRFPQLDSREDLWRILIALTRHKAVDFIRAETSQKKGGGKRRSFSVLPGNPSSAAISQPQDFAAKEPGPDDLVLLDDQLHYLMAQLPDETFRRIARLKIELCTVPEIAELIDVAPRTIERKLRLIRQIWAAELKDSES